MWRSAVSAVALALTLAAAPTLAVAPRTVVECRPQDDDSERIYRVIDRGDGEIPRWVLTLGSRRLGTRVVELPLPDAAVERTAERVSIASRSANGGLAVTIQTAGGASLLDVFVNFELEVNVWRDLSPDVESMNTDGPLSRANCRILPGREGLP